MNTKFKHAALAVALAGAASLFGGCSQMHSMMHGDGGGMRGGEHVMLSGANEVPPVSTSASAMGMVTVNADKSVSVELTTSGMTPTAAHIHQGAAGANGPVIVPLTKSGDNKFVSAPGAKLTDEQYEAYKAGKTYVNVHTDSHKGGEVRAQLAGR